MAEPQPKVEQRSSHARANDVSAKMGTRLLQGWAMLEEVCPRCNVPLMRQRKTNQLECVGCSRTGAMPSDFAEKPAPAQTSAQAPAQAPAPAAAVASAAAPASQRESSECNVAHRPASGANHSGGSPADASANTHVISNPCQCSALDTTKARHAVQSAVDTVSAALEREAANFSSPSHVKELAFCLDALLVASNRMR
eukprot:CAMPEP_0114617394 /NCGR_PEP_ID=MMETSP0168-20121206/7175_1 /TAXON_ID=95228 ORGANISM="Vannella sp., Strain DIVA3 517/6/12" /NCGR_SAMPLE_ID=MMETSP0168 /ASSEMBLY_ACC=CAM_ASM_000044 /LENGTH=196 /DNA_ID=CAMNT_0001828529 /DNA_START=313 /DNA_END=903 /DNA_ORIENTATION=-